MDRNGREVYKYVRQCGVLARLVLLCILSVPFTQILSLTQRPPIGERFLHRFLAISEHTHSNLY
jgi:hypothetical protein